MVTDETLAAITMVLGRLFSTSSEAPLRRVKALDRTGPTTGLAAAHASLPGARWVRVECERTLCAGIVKGLLVAEGGDPSADVDPTRLVPAVLALHIADRVADLLERPAGWMPTVVAHSPELVLAPLHTACVASYESNGRPLVVTVLEP
jgi:hypothetical protein